jgi:hypothetical protein
MERRNFLRLIASGLIGSTVDVDKLLWVPGAKTIFIPSLIKPAPFTSMGEIMRLEWENVLPGLSRLFERDDTFYRVIDKYKGEVIATEEFRIPLIIKPGR